MTSEKNPQILIVDRQLQILNALDSLLSRKGYRVSTCCSAQEAMQAVAGGAIDLVIAGGVGAERNSAALAVRIKRLSPSTSILLLMDAEDESFVAHAVAAGADGLLRRSYTESQVMQRVERILQGAQV